MGVEIERKFLVRGDAWREAARASTRIVQGYLVAEKERSVRVRIAGERARLTIKGETVGATRSEFEYEVPRDDADALLALCRRPLVEKVRHLVPHEGREFEVDVFEGENAGLVVAEVELEREDAALRLPTWIGDEVTGDPRFYNANLVSHPYAAWKDRP